MFPLPNPAGFGATDWIELLLAAVLLLLALGWRPWLEPLARRVSEGPLWSMLLLAALPVALRLILLPHHPAPSPDVYDEFGHLLVADTLRHLRLANPAHALSQFFETFFVLQDPTYSSIYPVGQGLVLAIGWTLFGLPWAGVLLAVAAFCALCYWMLRAWTTPGWALAGGLLAVFEFGPLSVWMNSYWGGAVAAAAGCLVFGALPRLRGEPRTRDAVLLGIGLGMHLLVRPFESIFLFLAAASFLVPGARRLRKVAPDLALALVPFAVIMLFQNKAVTGSWTTMPEMLSQYQYGVPSALTFQPNPVPHRELTPQQQLDYRMQTSFHGPRTDTVGSYLLRLEYRVRYYRFFFFAPLYLALAAFVAALREYRFVWVVLVLLLFALGTNFFPAFQVHYIAAVTGLFVLMSVTGLERLSRLKTGGREASTVLVFLCVAQFLFWYGAHLFEKAEAARAVQPYETWDAINHASPVRRIYVNNLLAGLPGKLLVFVRYYPRHIFQDEWVYNAADIDGARVVWARDLGAEEDEKLIRYYPGRRVLLLEPDQPVPKLAEYQPQAPAIIP